MKREMNDHSCLGEWFDPSDLLNQLIVIVAGAALLAANFGWIDRSFLSYWPIVLVVIGLRALMHNK